MSYFSLLAAPSPLFRRKMSILATGVRTSHRTKGHWENFTYLLKHIEQNYRIGLQFTAKQLFLCFVELIQVKYFP